jgi:hypothetical protein
MDGAQRMLNEGKRRYCKRCECVMPTIILLDWEVLDRERGNIPWLTLKIMVQEYCGVCDYRIDDHTHLITQEIVEHG